MLKICQKKVIDCLKRHFFSSCVYFSFFFFHSQNYIHDFNLSKNDILIVLSANEMFPCTNVIDPRKKLISSGFNYLNF